MGDDERGEFLYRYVSNVYAAKFNDDGSGEWRELSPEATGMKDMAEICIHTRLAASAVGATTMDRPEWVGANPKAAEVYCCLTNNKNRGIKSNAGGDPTPIGGPNPREANKYGQIVRWRPASADHTSSSIPTACYGYKLTATTQTNQTLPVKAIIRCWQEILPLARYDAF